MMEAAWGGGTCSGKKGMHPWIHKEVSRIVDMFKRGQLGRDVVLREILQSSWAPKRSKTE